MSDSPTTRESGTARGAGVGPLTRTEFAAAYQGCWRTLWCVAVGVLGDRAQAEDVVQEAALIAMGKLQEFDRGTNLTAWMARIVSNVALNHARRRRLERNWAAAARQEAQRPAGLRSQVDLPPHQVDGETDSADVLSAMEMLGETARTCLLMRTVLDLSYREIATALEIPEGTAMSHVHRARASLRARLMPRVDASNGTRRHS